MSGLKKARERVFFAANKFSTTLNHDKLLLFKEVPCISFTNSLHSEIVKLSVENP